MISQVIEYCWHSFPRPGRDTSIPCDVESFEITACAFARIEVDPRIKSGAATAKIRDFSKEKEAMRFLKREIRLHVICDSGYMLWWDNTLSFSSCHWDGPKA